MTPKDKAKDIIKKLYPYTAGLCTQYETEIAKICVNEIIENSSLQYGEKQYWTEVKQELEKL